MPELRMNAPVATRCGRWCAFTENRMLPSVLIERCSGPAAARSRGVRARRIWLRSRCRAARPAPGARRGEPPADPGPPPPVVELALVNDLVPGDRLGGLHVASG